MRTLAMSVTTVTCAVMAATWGSFVVWAVASSGESSGLSELIILGTIIGLAFGSLAAVTAFWPGAKSRQAPWVAAVVVAVLVLLLNGPYLPAALKNPGDTVSFVVGLLVVVSGLAIAIAGAVAARDASRQQQTWSRSGRVPVVLAALVAAVAASVATSVLAGSATGGGGRLAATPTVTGAVTAQNTKFTAPGITVKTGDVLGLFVINRDNTGHTFDIDSLGIHVSLAPNSATAISVAPTAPGTLTFYCSIPGHREAGMVGTILVQ